MQWIALTTILIFCQHCFADDLWLSYTAKGDCVASYIRAKKTDHIRKIDEKYCRDRNKDLTKRNICINNSLSKEDFSFFTDNCSAETLYLGLNGAIHELHQTYRPKNGHFLLGTFKGDGITVKVTNPRLIKKTYLTENNKSEDNVEYAEYAVKVTVKKKSRQKTFNGTLVYGI